VRRGPLLALALASLATDACLHVLDRCGPASAGAALECPVPEWFDRAFAVHVPARWDGKSALPLIVAFHGGGGNRAAAEQVTCPDGEKGGARCLAAIANAAGYVVVFPDGTGTRPTRNVRTWNAGGGTGGWHCVSAGACEEGVDDVAYFDALLAEVRRVVAIDPRRVFLTGLSNGGAIAHRLACERGATIAAIAPVGGTNQFAAAGGRCDARVPILHVHGTEDPCWGYATTDATCSILKPGRKVGVAESMEGWRVRNGCAATATEIAMPDLDPGDGTRIAHRAFDGCAAATEHLRVDGGGHTWPGGHQYLSVDTIGRVSYDLVASAEIVRFFDAHPRP